MKKCLAQENNWVDPAVIPSFLVLFLNCIFFSTCLFLPQQDTREEKEFRVSRLANAIRLDPAETDLTKAMNMIQKEGMTAKCLASKVTLDYTPF